MRAKSPHFVGQYNDLSAWKHKNKSLERIKPARMLNNSIEIPLGQLPLTDGKIHFIRKVDIEGEISILNEAFEVGKEFIDEYVWATICSKKQMIGIYYRAKDQDTAVLIKKFEYELNEEVKDLRPDEAVPQSKNSGKRKTNRALNPKRSDIFMVKINCGTASDIFKTL